MSGPALLAAAMILDAVLGEPRWLWSRLPHPAVMMGHAVAALDRRLNHGPSRRAKGVADTVIAGELERQSGEWTDLATEWLQRQHPGLLDFDARTKYYRRLVNRGFTHDQAMDALNRHPADHL